MVGFVSLKTLNLSNLLSATAYTAPEQQLGQLTPASDLFALGPTLLYLLTGKDPSGFYTSQENGVRVYPEYIPGVSPALVTIIRKLANPLLEERFVSAIEVREALGKAALSGEGI